MKNVNTPALPVSKKFYTYICERIGAACAQQADSAQLYSDSLALIEGYMHTRELPSPAVASPALLIFTLLLPEIDRAMTRSMIARMRALLRRQSDRPAAPESTRRAKSTATKSTKAASSRKKNTPATEILPEKAPDTTPAPAVPAQEEPKQTPILKNRRQRRLEERAAAKRQQKRATGNH